MKYQILGDSDCPMAQISMAQGEIVRIESGAMVYKTDVELKGKMNTKKSGVGGFMSAIGRSLVSGESMFITEATALSDSAYLGIAPPIPGKISKLTLDADHQYRLNTGSFLACDMGVNYTMKSQNVGRAIFGGTGGFFVMETEGTGDILVSAFGDLLALKVTDERPLDIDNGHVVAWDATLNYNIQAASGTIGFMTGEGLMNHFTGNGTVLIQTRNIYSLAMALRPYMPTASSGS